MKPIAAMIFMLLLAGCGPGPLAEMAYMPPDEFLHPYAGTVTVIPQDPNSPNVSEMMEKPTLKTALIRLPTTHTIPAEGPMSNGAFEPRRSAWRISDELRRCLFLIELGAANGAQDVNADPARRVIPAGYERTCAEYDWKPVYDRLALTAKWVGVSP